MIIFRFYKHFSEYGGEATPGPAFDPARHPSPAPTPSSSAFRPVMPSRQIVERQPRMLDFRVEYRDRNVDVVLEDSCTVGKVLLFAELLQTSRSLSKLSVYVFLN